MNSRPELGKLQRFLRNVRSVFLGNAPIVQQSLKAAAPVDDSATITAAGVPVASATMNPIVLPLSLNAAELIKEGLTQRQKAGTQAALPYFERAAQLEPGSHLPWFMLGNVASELGELDVAVNHYTRARDLSPKDHVIRYNLGLNQMWRGYIDAAIDELRAACAINPSYLQAHSSLIVALHNSDRIGPEEIDVTVREWGSRFSAENRALASPEVPRREESSGPIRVGFVSGDL
jgi:tetratricopeptide (TPR) repeat protein